MTDMVTECSLEVVGIEDDLEGQAAQYEGQAAQLAVKARALREAAAKIRQANTLTSPLTVDRPAVRLDPMTATDRGIAVSQGRTIGGPISELMADLAALHHSQGSVARELGVTTGAISRALRGLKPLGASKQAMLDEILRRGREVRDRAKRVDQK